MGNYVYQYLHPEYGHLYCGRTCNLDKRIHDHNNCKDDNIPRKYKKLLEESIIMYIELKNKAQEIAVEAYCIDKFKPFLNKSLKYDSEESSIEMKLPKWKIYNPKNLKYKQQLHIVEKEKEQLIEDISVIESDIKTQKDNLFKKKFELSKINYEVKAQNIINISNGYIEFELNDIKWFYKHCENKEVKFLSEVYDMTGKLICKGTMYYEFNRQSLVIEYYYGSCDNDPYIATEKDIAFSVYNCSLQKYYPNVNIYPEFYATLLSKKDELVIKNSIYNLNDLLHKYPNSCFHSTDRKITVWFRNGEIDSCQVELDSYDNGYKGIYDFNNIYDWDCNDGVHIYDENGESLYKKEKINPDVKEYIFSAQYYSPDREEKEEERVDELLNKMKNMIKGETIYEKAV